MATGHESTPLLCSHLYPVLCLFLVMTDEHCEGRAVPAWITLHPESSTVPGQPLTPTDVIHTKVSFVTCKSSTRYLLAKIKFNIAVCLIASLIGLLMNLFHKASDVNTSDVLFFFDFAFQKNHLAASTWGRRETSWKEKENSLIGTSALGNSGVTTRAHTWCLLNKPGSHCDEWL